MHPFPRTAGRRAAARCGRDRLGAGDGELRLRRGRQLARREPRRRRDIPGRDADGAPAASRRSTTSPSPRRRPARSTPPVVYALVNSRMFVSFDAGATWIADPGTLPARDRRRASASPMRQRRTCWSSHRARRSRCSSPRTKSALPRRVPASSAATTSSSSARRQSLWESGACCRTLGQQFSGNVLHGGDAARPRRRALLQPAAREDVRRAARSRRAPSDWHELDDGQHVHQDLHGVFLSPDFEATFEDGDVQAPARHRLDDERRRRSPEHRRRQDVSAAAGTSTRCRA